MGLIDRLERHYEARLGLPEVERNLKTAEASLKRVNELYGIQGITLGIASTIKERIDSRRWLACDRFMDHISSSNFEEFIGRMDSESRASLATISSVNLSHSFRSEMMQAERLHLLERACNGNAAADWQFLTSLNEIVYICKSSYDNTRDTIPSGVPPSVDRAIVGALVKRCVKRNQAAAFDFSWMVMTSTPSLNVLPL